MRNLQSTAKAYERVSRQQKRDALVLEHLYFVNQIVSLIAVRLPNNVDIENLKSAGVVGLIEAAGVYDDSKGASFKTFAYHRIHGAIHDELRRSSPLSQSALKLVQQIKRATEQLPSPVSPEQICEFTGLTIDKVEEGFEAMQIASPQQWDDFDSRQMTSNVQTPDALVEKDERQGIVANCLAALPERDRVVITLYYLEGLLLKEIAEVLDLSESRVSRVLARAMFRLKQHCKANTHRQS